MDRTHRAGPLIAAVFFALFYVASLFGILDLAEGTDSDAAVLASLADSGERAKTIAGVYLVAAAGIAFVWFLSFLRARIGEQLGARLSAAAFGGGLLYVAMLFVAGASFGVLPLAIGVGELEADAVDPAIARLLVQLGFATLLVFGLLAAVTMVLATSLGALRTAALPRWLAIAGFVVAALLLAGPAYMPQLLVPLWAVAVGVALARRPTAVEAAGQP